MRSLLVACIALGMAGCGDDTGGGAIDQTQLVDLAAPDLVSVGPSGIGAPCTGRGQGSCAAGQTCNRDPYLFPDGYCSQDCSGKRCPADADCQLVWEWSDSPQCWKRCANDSQCRAPQYLCTIEGGEGGSATVCMPAEVAGLGGGVRAGTRDGGACVTPVVSPAEVDAGAFAQDKQVSIPGSKDGETECHLAVDGARGRVVVAYIDLRSRVGGIGVVSSSSDGATFTSPLVLPIDKTVVKNAEQCDPVVAVTPAGDFYIVWLGFDWSDSASTGAEDYNIYVARSTNGGVTFPEIWAVAPPGEIAAGGDVALDKPWIAASPVDGSVYVTWNRENAQGRVDIRMTRTADGGRTWSAPVTVSDTNDRPADDRNLAQVYVGTDGKPVIAWVELAADGQIFGDQKNSVWLQRLKADGTRDGKNVRVTRPPDSPTFDDPSVVSWGQQVHVGFISGTPAGDWDVRVATSLDGGLTFGPSVKVNDDPTCATHFLHQLAVDARGDVHAIWYDNRYHPQGNVFYARSPAAGTGAPLAFGKNAFVNSIPFPFSTRRDQSNWLGDYLGLQATATGLYAAWSDPRTTNVSHVFFARARIP